METLIQLLVALGIGGLLTKGIEIWRDNRKNNKTGNTTLKLAEMAEDTRRLTRVESQVDNLLIELRKVEKENAKLQSRATTLEFILDEALKREEMLKEAVRECERHSKENPILRTLLSNILLGVKTLEHGAPLGQITDLADRVTIEAMEISEE